MAKLNNGALQNIEFQEIKSYLKENVNISGLTDFIRDYVQYILISENQDTFKKEEFNLMQGYIKNMTIYREILKHKLLGSEFSPLTVEKLILGQTPEEFEKMYENENVRNFLLFFPAKILEQIIKLYKIQTPEEFEKMCIFYEDRGPYSLRSFPAKNLEHIIKFYKIQTPEEFEKMYENENVRYILCRTKPKNLEYGIKLYKIQTPEEFEKMCENENVRNFLYSKESNIKLYDYLFQNEETQKKFADFLSARVWKDKHNTRVLFQNDIPHSKNFEKIFIYYLNHKQKSLISMMERLDHIAFFELNIDLDTFRTLDDFQDQDGNIQKQDLKKNFEKVMRLNSVSEENIQKSLNSLENCIRVNNIFGAENLLTENLIKYMDTLYHRKLKIKIRSYLKNTLGDKKIDFNTIEDKKFDNPDFIEAYKMSKEPIYNKKEIHKLLFGYLTGQYDQSNNLHQYNTEKNKNWLKSHLTPEQQQIWLGKNIEVIKLNTNHDEKNSEVTLQENKEIRIRNHIEVAIKKIQETNTLGYHFQTDFIDKGELKKYYNTVLKKEEESIKNKEGGSMLYADLKFQIDAIVELDKNVTGGKKRETSSVIIEKELDPLKCLMMGNWVDGSCLSFYSSVGNYYSAISNTIDVNKGVYYIRDEKGFLLGRCLITLGNDGKISRYKMYYSGDVSAPIDRYFDQYTANLAEKMGMELNGDENNVERIESDEWYKDGVKIVI